MLEVLRQQAPQFGVTVTDKDVQNEVAEFKEMFQSDQTRFDEALETEKLTLDQFKESLRQRAAHRRDEGGGDQGRHGDRGRGQGLLRRPQGRLHGAGDPRKARHILISPVRDGRRGARDHHRPRRATGKQAKAEAEKVRSEIQNGADFRSARPRKYSDDEATTDAGGELGTIIRGQMVPEFEAAVFSLKKGELSRPVRTEYGYHLIQVTDITPEKQLPYDQVKEKIRSCAAGLSGRRPPGMRGSRRWRRSSASSYRSGFAPLGRGDHDVTLATSTTATAPRAVQRRGDATAPPPRPRAQPWPRRHRLRAGRLYDLTMTPAAGVPLGPQADPGEHHRLHAGGDARAGRRHPRARPRPGR